MKSSIHPVPTPVPASASASASALSLDWDLIRTFVAALNEGSLLAAAKVLNTSQPTMGRRIAELEAQWGVALFERTGRGVRPTQAALALADAARQMEQASFALHQRLTQQQKGEAGTVRITASTTVATYLLPSVLARMQLDLPAIQVELVSSNAVSNLLRREADIALRSVQPDQSSVIARRVGKLTLGIYAHTRYLQQRGEPKSPEQLLNHTLLGNDQDTAIIDGLRRSGLTVDKSDFALRTDDFLAYWQLLRAGAGIGFVSDLLARTDAQVKPLLTAAKIPPLPLWLVVHREVRGNPRIKAVFDYLADAVPGLL